MLAKVSDEGFESVSYKFCLLCSSFCSVMPGRLVWSVGYFTKVRLMDFQVAYKGDDGINTVEQLKDQSFRNSSRKLREAKREDSAEAEQTKEQDFENVSTDMITTSVPSQIFPSGILSIQIHQVVGLELEKQSRTREPDGGQAEDGLDEDGDHLPNAYCTVILNHQKIFKTRTKPRNSKPFVSQILVSVPIQIAGVTSSSSTLELNDSFEIGEPHLSWLVFVMPECMRITHFWVLL